MGEFSRDYSVDDTTGATVAVDKNSSRSEVILRSAGADRVYISIGEPCDGTGMFLDSGDGLILTGVKAKSDIYLACASGETATVAIIDTPF